MLEGGFTGRVRERLKRVRSSRLAVPLRPASSGPVRYWQDQLRLAVKGAIAAVGAWALARYAVGQPDPYFAPLGVATGLAVNVLVFPPLQLRPAEHAIRQWGDDIARALEDLSSAAADPGSGMQCWPRHDRQLTEATERARAAARRARESLRWNLRAKAERAVPRPDGAVLDSLDRRLRLLADHSDARSAAQHLTRLTSDIISEVAELIRSRAGRR